MKQSYKSAMIQVGSAAGWRYSPGATVYAGSKGFANILTTCMKYENKNNNMTYQAYCPMPMVVQTGINPSLTSLPGIVIDPTTARRLFHP